MKRIMSLFLSILMLLSLTLTGCATEKAATTQVNKSVKIILQIGNPNMTVNGEEKPIDIEGISPIIMDERTLLPIRAVIEEIGGSVGWNDDTREVTLNYCNDKIVLTVGSTTANLNGVAQAIDTAPVIINDRTMLPIRFIAESFHFNIDWTQQTQTITIINTTASEIPIPTTTPTSNSSLVVYFSNTGNTKSLAEKIAEITGSDIYELIPKTPYTSEDLNYNDNNSRANKEMNDETARPEINGALENIANYDTILLGYPIWWGTCPRIINTFLESYDFSGKTIMPFCTSGSSNITTSVSVIKTACPDADVKEGMRATSSASNEQIERWLNNNGFKKDMNSQLSENNTLKILIGETILTATLADNSSVAALKELLAQKPLTINMSDYANFEKVGPLGTILPRNDEQITTEAGDLILYQGNSFVIYYDTNSWNFTKLGKINNLTGEQLREILGAGDVTVTLSIN